MNLIQKHEKYLLKFIGRITGNEAESISEIDSSVLLFTRHLEYTVLILPFVKEDLHMGSSLTQLTIKYSITRRTARTLVQKVDSNVATNRHTDIDKICN